MCIAADRGINEKSSMEMIKGLIAAPGSDSPEDGRAEAECQTSRIPADWQGHIGAQLRALYGSLINEPVPDKFYHLLKELDAKEPKAIEQEDKS